MADKFNEYLKLAQSAYGGELYLNLKNYKLKNIPFLPYSIKKVPDAVLSKQGRSGFFSFKNEESGFSASVFEHIKTGKIIIAFRGTERVNLGENIYDVSVWGKDIAADINLITGVIDRQFYDAGEFYKCVKLQNPKSKIILTGHSLGGALAQLTAAKAFSQTCRNFFKTRLETYTYNAPGISHLLKAFGCREDLDYKFIKNYAVMNDWCGMYGSHAGETYLIPPISMKETVSAPYSDIINNVLLSTHEGIFNVPFSKCCRIIKKPADFNQSDGLALWYYDKNNPLRNLKSLQSFFEIRMPKFNIQSPEKLPEALKGMLKKIRNTQENIKEKFLENINYEIFKSLSDLIDKTIENITEENLKTALKVLEKNKIPIDSGYIENLKSVISSGESNE